MKPIIEVSHLSKAYQIGHVDRGPRGSLSEELSRLAKGSFGRRARTTEQIRALDDVSFTVEPNEIVGIIGKNGSGKSTLLKILSRIVDPTSGQAIMRGRTASLLEVGTGFHPELTGRENVYLNGAILGMRRSQIERKFDEIVEFSGVERFLDTPVKFYSSGMYVRLAFAVAAHLEPDILIVDEVLAVGDAEFQKKSLGKMRDVTKRGDRTVLFVSHNMGAIRQLCSRAILLDQGRATAFDSVDDAIAEYQVRGSANTGESEIQLTAKDVQLKNFRVDNLDLSLEPEIFSGDPIEVTLSYESKEKHDLCVGFGLKAKSTGALLVFTHNHLENVRHETAKSGALKARLELPRLAPADYALELSVWLDGQHVIQDQEIGTILVAETAAFGSGSIISAFPSALLVNSEWSFEVPKSRKR
jgi:lipopolysaccharide transport system ATP-binding protein